MHLELLAFLPEPDELDEDAAQLAIAADGAPEPIAVAPDLRTLVLGA